MKMKQQTCIFHFNSHPVFVLLFAPLALYHAGHFQVPGPTKGFLPVKKSFLLLWVSVILRANLDCT